MRVLMFGWEFPPHISGGLGTACYGLTKGMSKIKNLEIIFVVPKIFGNEDTTNLKLIGASQIPIKISTLQQDKPFIKSLEYIEVASKIIPYTSPEAYQKYTKINTADKIHYIETSAHGNIHFTGEYNANLFNEIYNYALVAKQLVKMYDFDIIHAHDWLTYPAGIAAKQASGKPLVLHVHATDFDRSGGKINPDVFTIEKKGLDQADSIITVSNFTRKTVIDNYHINPEKIFTVYNAVEPNNINPKTIEQKLDEKIVTFLGRITMQKGPEYFIELANLVLQKMNNVRFVMAGSGDMMQKMILHAAKLGITDKFHFTGFLTGDDVNKMFSRSDLYIMPSISEPFGISPLEAMQAGVPVIISKQSGVSEILKHVFKVDFWDINKMANVIYAILNYPALTHTLVANAKNEANNLKWEESAKQVLQIYNRNLK